MHSIRSTAQAAANKAAEKGRLQSQQATAAHKRWAIINIIIDNIIIVSRRLEMSAVEATVTATAAVMMLPKATP